MITRRKKPAPVQRTPNIVRQKQSTFQYSSNRTQSARSGARKEGQESDKKNDKKSAVWSRLNRWPIIIGSLLGLAAVVYLSLLTGQPHVKTVAKESAVRDNLIYAKAADEVTNNLRSHSKFTLDRQKITADLRARFPELSSVDVSTPLFSRYAVIDLTVSKPELLLRSGSDEFILNNNGVAILTTSQASTTVRVDTLVTVTDESNTRIEIGRPALTTNQVSFINEVKHQSVAKQLIIETISMAAGGGELAVRYTDIPYSVKYSVAEDARKSFGTFYSTKEFLDRTKVKPAEYIDVRIAERAYVK